MDMNIRFDNKVTLITGGSAGIGFAAAELFGALGAKVAICGTNPDKLERAAAQLREKGITVYHEVCDVGVAESLTAFANHTEEALGPVDIWVSNAGIYPQYSIIDTDEPMWDRIMNTNMKSVYLGARLAYQSMKNRGGVILLASSFSSIVPSVGSGVYAATKSAVSSMTRTLAAELAPYGIRVNAYIPGLIDTDMTHEIIEANDAPLREAVAMREFGKPIDIAWAMAFMASDFARYITGETMVISGGKIIVQNPAKAWADKERRER